MKKHFITFYKRKAIQCVGPGSSALNGVSPKRQALTIQGQRVVLRQIRQLQMNKAL